MMVTMEVLVAVGRPIAIMVVIRVAIRILRVWSGLFQTRMQSEVRKSQIR